MNSEWDWDWPEGSTYMEGLAEGRMRGFEEPVRLHEVQWRYTVTR